MRSPVRTAPRPLVMMNRSEKMGAARLAMLGTVAGRMVPNSDP